MREWREEGGRELSLTTLKVYEPGLDETASVENNNVYQIKSRFSKAMDMAYWEGVA